MESKLINIKDIEARNRIEPPEVTAIRDNIKKSFRKLRFEEGPHIYHLKVSKDKEIILPSVSSMTHRFQPYVDWDQKAENYGLKWGYDKEFVQRVWEENNIQATNNGTSTHLYGEAFMHFFMGHPENIPDIIKPQYEKGYLIPYSIKQEGVLKFYRDLSAFKLFLPDVGLLGAAMEVDASDVILSNVALEEYKGALTEQYVCQQLVACGITPYYWTSGSTAELDFVVSRREGVVPIEVKAEENLRARSLRLVHERYGLHGVRTSMSGYREQDWMTNVPLWAIGACFLSEEADKSGEVGR